MLLTTQQIEEIVQAIVRAGQPARVILFGSYAKGTARPDSDLDLAIVKNTTLPQYKRAIEFQKALWDCKACDGIGLDILVYTPAEISEKSKQPMTFVYEILNTGKTLYEQPS